MFPEIQIPTEVVAALQLAGTILGAYLLAIWFGLVVWTFQDIRRRTHSWAGQLVAVLIVFLFSLPGLLLYMLIRPGETMATRYERSLEEAAILNELEQQHACPSCKRGVQPDFIVCPYCQTKLKQPCSRCGQPLALRWKACPYCALPVGTLAPSPPEERLGVTSRPQGAEEPSRA